MSGCVKGSSRLGVIACPLLSQGCLPLSHLTLARSRPDSEVMGPKCVQSGRT